MPMRPLASLLLSAALLTLAGCASQGTTPPAAETAPAPPPAAEAAKPAEPVKTPAARKAETELAKGLGAYDNGDYKVAAQALQQSLELGLPSRLDQARAYKHLAFIACASRQEELCKAHFRKALAAAPKLTLSKTEAGHPVWGPAFQQVKAEAAGKKAK
ncbi:MAG TPA: TssQ family T6SS-associated lipoprotein [Azospira sp.]|nr:TssQ family T6SS-associated lipoprotein [Azospira sp.]